MDIGMQLDEQMEIIDETIYAHYYKTAEYVIRNILRGIGSNEDIEDCVHETLEEVLMNREKFDVARGSIKTYVCVIARSKALYARKKLVKHQTVPLEDDLVLVYDDELEVKEAVKHILKQLNANERKLFTLRFLYYMPIEEVSKTLGLSRGNVDVKLSRLRKKLVKLFNTFGIDVREGR